MTPPKLIFLSHDTGGGTRVSAGQRKAASSRVQRRAWKLKHSKAEYRRYAPELTTSTPTNFKCVCGWALRRPRDGDAVAPTTVFCVVCGRRNVETKGHGKPELPPVQTIAEDGNRDPFQSLSVPMTPAMQALLHLSFTRVAETYRNMDDPDTYKSLGAMQGGLADPACLFGIIGTAKLFENQNTMPSYNVLIRTRDEFGSADIIQFLHFRQESIKIINKRMLSDPYGPLFPLTVKAVVYMMTMAFMIGSWDEVLVHGEGLAQLIVSGPHTVEEVIYRDGFSILTLFCIIMDRAPFLEFLFLGQLSETFTRYLELQEEARQIRVQDLGIPPRDFEIDPDIKEGLGFARTVSQFYDYQLRHSKDIFKSDISFIGRLCLRYSSRMLRLLHNHPARHQSSPMEVCVIRSAQIQLQYDLFPTSPILIALVSRCIEAIKKLDLQVVAQHVDQSAVALSVLFAAASKSITSSEPQKWCIETMGVILKEQPQFRVWNYLEAAISEYLFLPSMHLPIFKKILAEAVEQIE